MRKRESVVPTGQLAPFARGFREELVIAGYSRSAAKKQLNLMVHLDRWLESENLDLQALASKPVEAFFLLRREEGRSNLLTTRSMAPLVTFLCKSGAIEVPGVEPATGAVDVVVERFADYLRCERGLVEGTIAFYRRVTRRFLVRRFGDGPVELGMLSAADVTDFVTAECRPLSISSARQSVSALRSFLRFVRMEGLTTLALDQAVLAVAGWNPSLPRAIEAADAERLLVSCDRRRALGRRDFAILMLLARLGLRAGEVVALELSDIDWRAGQLLVRGKRRRRDLLPLSVEVGEAIAGYLRRGRPASADRRVFLRHHAPHIGFEGSGAIRGVLDRACRRAGMAYVNPHRLRHTVATGCWPEVPPSPRSASCCARAVRSPLPPTRRSTTPAWRPWLSTGRWCGHEHPRHPLTRDAVRRLITRHAITAAKAKSSLAAKRVAPHVLHSCAMQLREVGDDSAVIALWLGHESIRTTDIYQHADLGLKERALARAASVKAKSGRYRPSDELLRFLEGL